MYIRIFFFVEILQKALFYEGCELCLGEEKLFFAPIKEKFL
jgi:hypothetical protein